MRSLKISKLSGTEVSETFFAVRFLFPFFSFVLSISETDTQRYGTDLYLLLIVTDPRAMRISVKGDILSLEKPAASWIKNFKGFETFSVSRFR